MEGVNYERGAQLFEMGRYNDAISYLKNAVSENADSFSAKYLLAQCYFQIDDIKKAKLLANDVLKIAPNYSGVYFLLSQIELHSDKKKEALKLIDEAISLSPYSADYFGQKAYTFIALKKFDKALDSANQGLAIDAKSNFCLNARAIALTKLNKKDEAKDTVENLLHDNPEDAYSHANVAWSYLEHNNTEKALTHFKEALVLDPNLEFARDGMLTAIKSKNKIYSLYLRYRFWISKQTGQNQWIFLIGIYLIYRFAVNMLSTSGFTMLVIPLIIAYLLFALGSWIMEPLSNAILQFDSHGKYILNKNEKLSGILFACLFLIGLITFGIGYPIDSGHLTIIGIACFAAILPMARAPLTDKKNSKILGLAYGGLMLCIALFAPLIVEYYNPTLIILIMFIAYTWLGNFFK